ncbi:CC_3452 family protein [Altererythrobacter sp. MF3-039]|uniref:CC_3452 family protein n=1 Tax=Altererythrobacter sp. MF3-039 TaxID=3252901 RepID=UPI00390C9196
MSFSLPRISFAQSAGAAVLAMAYTAVTFGATLAPAPAQANDIFYRAELASPASEARTVAGGVAWYCSENVCVAGKGTSRPLRMCRAIAKEFGEVASFSAKGEELAVDKLSDCNGN